MASLYFEVNTFPEGPPGRMPFCLHFPAHRDKQGFGLGRHWAGLLLPLSHLCCISKHGFHRKKSLKATAVSSSSNVKDSNCYKTKDPFLTFYSRNLRLNYSPVQATHTPTPILDTNLLLQGNLPANYTRTYSISHEQRTWCHDPVSIS